MREVIGNFIEVDARGAEGLLLRFSPRSVPLKRRWRNNGLSADFVADYVTTFLPLSDAMLPAESQPHDVRSAVSHIANELLENAMKYSGENANHPIILQLVLESGGIVFTGTNTVSPDQARRFRDFIQLVETMDIADLFVQQMEAGAREGSTSSGLGLVSMINDYGGTLAWKFEPTPDALVTVTTQVQLRI